MRVLLLVSIVFSVIMFAEFSIGKPKKGKQISFAIPALNLLNGGNNNNNNNNNGNNIFGARTTTRTIVRTVATITVPAWRTCTTTMAGITPCPGRRRREVQKDNGVYVPVEASPVIILKIGNTKISDPVDVANYLEAHHPLPSVIVNEDVPNEDEAAPTTVLYSSKDVYEQNDAAYSEIDLPVTTETPYSDDLNADINEDTTPRAQDDLDLLDKARINFGSITTITSTISVTSVATTYATGGMTATLTVMYQGCSPPSLPYSGMPC